MGRVADLSIGAHIAIARSTEFAFAQRQKRLYTNHQHPEQQVISAMFEDRFLKSQFLIMQFVSL